MDTALSKGNLSQTEDEKAAYDAACKRILSERIILAWILKSCLEEFRDCDIQEIADKYIEANPQISEVPVMPDEGGTMIQGIDTEDKSVSEGTVLYDIRFYAVTPSREHIRLIINIEAQFKYYPGYPLSKRGIYYCSRMISSQYGVEFTKSHYEKIKKVYSIWICMNPPKKRRNTITRYHMTEDNLVGKAHEKVKNYDLLSVIMICLGGPDDKNYSGILKLLDILFTNKTGTAEKKKILQKEFDIHMTPHLESEVSAMCNWSDGIEEKGMVKRGLTDLRNLMETLGLTLEAAMAALKIPESERTIYAELLKNSQPDF